MNKDIPVEMPSRTVRVLPDLRVQVEWTCPLCNHVNVDAAMAPSGGFSCAECGVCRRVEIKRPVS